MLYIITHAFANKLICIIIVLYLQDSHVAKVVHGHNSTHVANKPMQGTRGSKRVVALDVPRQEIRFTRQRSAAINQQSSLSLTTTTHASS
jgi:hypothetical protein